VVLAYLSRYTHRVAITNRRLEALDLQNQTVSFAYKDYAHGSCLKSMTLSLEEFLRRFNLHILPTRFVKIRHHGLFANRARLARIAKARELLTQLPVTSTPLLEMPEPLKSLEPLPLICPFCGFATLILLRVIPRPSSRAPPIADTS
jgi:hypothetical protein